MQSIELAPNKRQTAIALSLCSKAPMPGQSGAKKHQIAVVPPGKGKTRIAMATALALLKKYVKAVKIVVVWPNKLLLN